MKKITTSVLKQYSVGSISDAPLNINAWNWKLPNGISIDTYNKFSSSDGYIIPFDGLYEIYVHCKFKDNGGGKSSNYIGYTTDKRLSDTYRGAWQRQDWRRETCVSHQEYLSTGTSIQFLYYVDGNSSKLADFMEMTIKLLHRNDYTPINGSGTTNAKYTRNENGEVVSPICQGQSVMITNGEPLNNFYNKKTKLVACAAYGECTFSSEVKDTIDLGYFSKENVISVYTNNKEIVNATTSGMPHFMITKSGYYNIGVAGRVQDYSQETQDSRIMCGYYSAKNNASDIHHISGGRMGYRFGYSGMRTIHFNRGDVVYPRIWRDLAFSNFEYLTFYVEQAQLDNDNTPWTLEEARKFMQKKIDYMNIHKSADFFRDFTFTESKHTEDYWQFLYGTAASGEDYVRFSKKNSDVRVVLLD